MMEHGARRTEGLRYRAKLVVMCALSVVPVLRSPFSVLRTGPSYTLSALDGTSFLEVVNSSVVSRTAGAESRRSLARAARFGITLSHDTLLVSIDSLDLTQSGDGTTRSFDAGGVLGGRWKLFLAPNGAPNVLLRPFVPEEITDVSDVAAAMTDFFPPAPPQLVVNGVRTDTVGIRWQRRPDSAGVERYHWSQTRQHQGVRTVADTVALQVHENTTESGEMAWLRAGAPVAWTRIIHSEVTSTIRNRTVQSVLDQRIVVRRERP